METKIRRIKGEIRQRMIESRDYYCDALESLRGGGDEPGTEIFRGWLEAKMREAERTIAELTPKALHAPIVLSSSVPARVSTDTGVSGAGASSEPRL